MQSFLDTDIHISKISHVVYVKPGFGVKSHRNRPYYGLAIRCSGKMLYTFDTGTQFYNQPGEIVFFPKNSNYDIESVCSGDCYAINFEIEGDPSLEPFCFALKNKSLFFKLFREAESLWCKKSKGYYEKCCAAAYSVLAEMKAEMSSGYICSSTAAIIEPAIAFINENYVSGEISILQLAQLCGISEVYLRTIFKKQFAVSPVKYINNLKISRAAELIDSKLYSLSEVAGMSGFSDYSYFSREFKKIKGVSPNAYCKANAMEQGVAL